MSPTLHVNMTLFVIPCRKNRNFLIKKRAVEVYIEMKLISKSLKPTRLLGLKVHHGGFEPLDSLEW
jgi:hypothetical protein